VPRPLSRRLLRATSRGNRGADARRKRHLPLACPLRRQARRLRALQQGPRGSLPVRLSRRARRRAGRDWSDRSRLTRRASAAVDEGAVAYGEVRIRLPLERRRAGLDEWARLGDDAAVLRRSVQTYRERVRADEGAQQQPVGCVVDEAEVDIRIINSGVAAER